MSAALKIPARWGTLYPLVMDEVTRNLLTPDRSRGDGPLETFKVRLEQAINEDRSFTRRGGPHNERERKMRETWLVGVLQGKARIDCYGAAMETVR